MMVTAWLLGTPGVRSIRGTNKEGTSFASPISSILHVYSIMITVEQVKPGFGAWPQVCKSSLYEPLTVIVKSATREEQTLSLEIVPFETQHLQDAAALVNARYSALRERVPALPSRYEDASAILPSLRDLADRVPGVAALRGGRLAGFLLGMAFSEFRGQRSVFSPEWANAADPDDSRRVYEEMYTRLAARWVANGCFTHLISMLAHDREGIEGWHWLGFGLLAVDGVRDLDQVHGPSAGVTLRRGSLEDIEPAMALIEALQRHVAAPPTFLAYVKRESKRSQEEWLENPAHALWLAYQGAEAVACIGLGPANPEACHVIRDEKTASIVKALTMERARGQGIATALLNRSLDWARSEGYERCAVDFEPMNVLAARFWMRHFQPVCYALARCVDERIAWAHTKREHKDMW
jgi:GNAT superfamily N-acetyltransferase